MQKYQRLAIQMANHFDEIKFVHLPREENSKADEVAQIALSKQQTHDEGLMIEVLTNPNNEDPSSASRAQRYSDDSNPFIHLGGEVTRRS